MLIWWKVNCWSLGENIEPPSYEPNSFQVIGLEDGGIHRQLGPGHLDSFFGGCDLWSPKSRSRIPPLIPRSQKKRVTGKILVQITHQSNKELVISTFTESNF